MPGASGHIFGPPCPFHPWPACRACSDFPVLGSAWAPLAPTPPPTPPPPSVFLSLPLPPPQLRTGPPLSLQIQSHSPTPTAAPGSTCSFFRFARSFLLALSESLASLLSSFPCLAAGGSLPVCPLKSRPLKESLLRAPPSGLGDLRGSWGKGGDKNSSLSEPEGGPPGEGQEGFQGQEGEEAAAGSVPGLGPCWEPLALPHLEAAADLAAVGPPRHLDSGLLTGPQEQVTGPKDTEVGLSTVRLGFMHS